MSAQMQSTKNVDSGNGELGPTNAKTFERKEEQVCGEIR